MGHTYGKASTRTSGNTSPITTASFTITADETVLVLMLKVNGGTNRAGGAPTFAGQAMTQANSTQKAASSPEASAELWYLLDPPVGSNTCTIPNTGTSTIFYELATGKATRGGRSVLDQSNGANGTSTNPAPGSVTTTKNGCIGFACVATGAQTWAPSAQAGTIISNNDDGATGGGTQYHLQATLGAINLNWTFGTSDDWGAVVAYFKDEVEINLSGALTGDLSEAFASGGTVSVSVGTAEHGGNEYKANPTTTGTGFVAFAEHYSGIAQTSMSLNPGYVRFRFKPVTLPAANSEEIFQFSNGGSMTMGLRIDSAGKLRVYDQTNTAIGSLGATALVAGTSYRIGIMAGGSSNAAWEVTIDGVSEISGSGADFGAVHQEARFGKVANRNGQTVDFRYTDIRINDYAIPGVGQVGMLKPVGDGNTTAWTGTWQDVDDTPHDSDTTYISSSTDAQQESEAMTDASAATPAAISGIVAVVKSLAIVKNGSLKIRTRSVTTVYDSPATSPSAGTYEPFALLHRVDPATGAAWTVASIDGLEVGVVKSGGAETRVTLLAAMIDYSPAGGGLSWLAGRRRRQSNAIGVM